MISKSGPKIAVIGSLNIDVVVEAERVPKIGETVLGKQVHFLPGGKGANQAVALARLGADVSMIGAVGQDAFGEQLVQALQTDGVHTNAVKTLDQVVTGMAQILLTQGNNSIIVVPGANDHCTPADIKNNEHIISQADAVLLQLEIPMETVQFAVQIAKKHDKKVILNPAPVRQLSAALLRNVDYITPNETELAKLTGIELGSQQSLTQAMKKLIDMGVGNVITTLGAEGAAWMNKKGEMDSVSGHEMNVIDTTGAGDSFNAGLSLALSSGNSLKEAVSFSNQVSALAVTKLGAQAGMPLLKEVHFFFPS